MRRLATAVVASCVAGLLSTFAACSTVETHEAPDAAAKACDTGPAIHCAVAKPEEQGCNTDEGTAVYLTRLPKATRYALGCSVYFVGVRDEQGDCPVEAVCKCVMSDTIAPPTGLPPASDASTDGEAADASNPPPVDTSPPHPVWFCSP
jgi:hypothetical protein